MRRFASPISTWPANLWGYRLRSGWRYYTKGHHQNRTDFYLSSWLQVKQLYVSENDFVERFGGAFRERMDLRETRNYLGAFFALGWQGAISPNSRWEHDYGMGVRYQKHRFWTSGAELVLARLDADIYPRFSLQLFDSPKKVVPSPVTPIPARPPGRLVRPVFSPPGKSF